MALVCKNFSDIITFTRASTATYFDSAGVLTTAAIDAPRLDYNPSTLAAQGLLIEESRANLLTQSEAFNITHQLTVTGGSGTFVDGETVTATGGGTGAYIAGNSTASIFAIANGTGTFTGTLTGGTSGATRTISSAATAWTKGGSTVSTDTTTAPTGTVVADSLIEDTSTGQHRVFRNATGTTNTNPYTLSVFAKANTRTRIYLGIAEGTTFVRQGNAVFDLSAGTVVAAGGGSGGATGGSATIQNVGNGWYRCTYTLTLGGTDTTVFSDIDLVSTGTTISYTGDGTSGIFLFGAQLEAGAFPTSYIPTTTTALTRAADVTSVNTLSPWFNASAGTIYAEFAVTQPASGANQFLARFSDNSYNNSIADNIISTGFAAIATASGGVFDGTATTVVAVSANTVTKFAGAYAANDLAACKDGGAVATDSTATIPSGLSRFDLGSDHAGANRVKAGYLRRITYYPTRLSNAQLQAITA